jgi:hypothetical protein
MSVTGCVSFHILFIETTLTTRSRAR